MKTFRNIFVQKELRKKISLVLLVLCIYKLGTFLIVPGINHQALENMNSNSGLMGFANIITGGALKNFSILAIGIMPYITASIIIQLLQMDVNKTLTEWAKQGEAGQKKTKKITKYFAVVLSFIESLGLSFGMNKMYPGLIIHENIWNYLLIALFLTLGTVCLMIMGDIVDKKGLGNGISIIIVAGILNSVPSLASMYYIQEFSNVQADLFIRIVKTVGLLILILVLLASIVIVQNAERRIPIQNPKTTNGKTMLEKGSFLPIKLNAAGVIPVIFAVSLLVTPMTIAQYFPQSDVTLFITKYLNYRHPVGMVFYAGLIIAFSYFYAFVQVNPEKVAQNLRQSGSFVPGMRPGKQTELYIRKILIRLTFWGSLFLTIVSIIPIILGNQLGLPQQIQIGGTSLIIIVSVALDVAQRIEVELVQKKYKGFLRE